MMMETIVSRDRAANLVLYNIPFLRLKWVDDGMTHLVLGGHRHKKRIAGRRNKNLTCVRDSNTNTFASLDMNTSAVLSFGPPLQFVINTIILSFSAALYLE